ncbi:MAG: phosphatidylglycerophosphatase A [Thioalkalispiraceae bacterium]|jgi:phosphatidylglycerophosphatase A
MNTSRKEPRLSMLLHPAHFLSFGFGSGFSPIAPGTAGTAITLPIFWLMSSLSPWQYLAAVLLMFVIGVWVCEITSRHLGVHDHGAIVWDEVVGYLLTMVMVPAELTWMIIGFFVFRLFDIWKPWPTRDLDRSVKGGFGIMLDDVMAAVYSSITMQVMLYIWRSV